MSDDQTFNLRIHEEDGMLWADVEELPGCFASGETLDELQESAIEAILMVTVGSVARKERHFRKSPPMPVSHGRIQSAKILVH